MDKHLKLIVIGLTINNLLWAFVWPILRIRRRHNIFPISLRTDDGVASFIGRTHLVCLASTILSAVFFSFVPAVYRYFNPLRYLEVGFIQITGVVMNLFSFIWIVVGQAQMEETWRIGIHEREKNRLIDTGLFRFSRHPIFLGLIGLAVSTFLCMPNTVTFAVMVVALILIKIEALLEEKELLAKHGTAYRDYCQRTRRWI